MNQEKDTTDVSTPAPPVPNPKSATEPTQPKRATNTPPAPGTPEPKRAHARVTAYDLTASPHPTPIPRPMPPMEATAAGTLQSLGDSLSAPSYISSQGYQVSGYYIDMIAGALHLTVLNHDTGSVSGSLLRDAITNFSTRVAPGVERIIVNLGTNDSYRMALDESGTSYQQDWHDLWAKLNALSPRPQVTVMGLLPTLYGMGCPWAWNDKWLIEYMNTIARDVCYLNGGTFVPLPAVTADMIRPDHHLNPRGHAYAAGEVLSWWNVA